jgi:hypothetical protein
MFRHIEVGQFCQFDHFCHDRLLLKRYGQRDDALGGCESCRP